MTPDLEQRIRAFLASFQDEQCYKNWGILCQDAIEEAIEGDWCDPCRAAAILKDFDLDAKAGKL